MKKSMLVAALFMGCVGYSKAETRLTPSGPSNALHTSDYGGVSYSTIAFSTANVIVFTGAGSVLGFVASSNTASTDFIMFRDTDSLVSTVSNTDQATHAEFSRVYLSTASGYSLDIIPRNGFGTTYKFPAAILVNKGLAVRPVTAASNGVSLITILYTKFGR